MTGNAEGVRVDLGSVVADLVFEDPVVAGAHVDLVGRSSGVFGLAGHAVRAFDAVPSATRDLLEADAVAMITTNRVQRLMKALII